MKRLNLLLIFSIIVVLLSCGGAETKADPSPDTIRSNKERTGPDKIPESQPAAAASANSDSSLVIPGSNEIILAGIDQYLLSTPSFEKNSGGISNATITVKNTLSGITFQKAIIEVDILAADGKLLKNNFYPIQNIEPGDVETIKIPAVARAFSIKSHVVKVKSNQLTNGEMVIVGTLYEPGK